MLFGPLFNLGVFFMFVSLIMLSIAFLTRYYLLLALTDERVIIRHGIINLDTIELPHSRIESVELARTIMARLLGYSTVMITGTGSRRTAVPFIADAHLFRAALDDILIQRDRQGKAT